MVLIFVAVFILGLVMVRGYLHKKKKREQAGAELSQAQDSGLKRAN